MAGVPMKNLAPAVVESFAFFELSDQDTVHSDNTVSVVEGLHLRLAFCTAAAQKALTAAADVERAHGP